MMIYEKEKERKKTERKKEYSKNNDLYKNSLDKFFRIQKGGKKSKFSFVFDSIFVCMKK